MDKFEEMLAELRREVAVTPFLRPGLCSVCQKSPVEPGLEKCMSCSVKSDMQLVSGMYNGHVIQFIQQ
jgi:hypothetical protein